MFGNLLKIAATAIPQQSLQWERFTHRELIPGGKWISRYDAPKPIKGSIQAVDLRSYQQLGFDTTQRYWTLYTSHPVSMTGEDRAPDIVHWQGKRMEPIGETPWNEQDGWRGVYLVEITRR